MFLRLIILAFLFISSLNVNAQFYKRNQLDSLKKALEKQNDITEIKTLLHLSEAYANFHLDSALTYAKIAKKNSKKINYNYGLYRSYYCEANTLFDNSPIEHIKPKLQKSSSWFRANDCFEDYIKCGLLYTQLIIRQEGKRKAQKVAFKVLNAAKDIRNSKLIGKAWFNIFFY